MKIVDDDELCSSFNWGSLSYETLLKLLNSCLKPNENEKDKDKDKDSYTILGFPFAFCVWIMEVLPIFQEKQFVKFQECDFPRMLCYLKMKSPQYNSLCKKYFHNENLYKLIEVSPFIPIEEDTEPISVEEPISQDQSSMSSSTQFDETMHKEIVKRLSESFKKDMHAEVTRINQKIVVSRKKIKNEIKDLKKSLGSKLDTLLKIYVKPDERNIERESSIPITKDGVDDHCHGTEPIVTINKDTGGVERDDMDVHAEVQYESDFRDAHLDDETDNVIEIGKESIDGVEVQDEDLESLLGISVSEIVCKCFEETYDLSTPLSYKEKFGVQNCVNQDGTCDLSTPRSLTDNIGSQENASEDNDLTGMILTIANESCELATEEHREQLQDKENVQLEDKENDATNMSAQLSIEKTQEGSVNKTVPVQPEDRATTSEEEQLRLERFKREQTDIYADDNSVRKNPYKLNHQKINSKMFFLDLSDSSFHIDIALYYLRKKECYHPRDHPFRCTTTYILFDNYMVPVYKDFNEDSTNEFWCGNNQLFLTPYVWGDSRRCGIAWTEVDKIFFPCRLPSENDNAVTHFLLGVLDLNEKKIDVYDSIYSEPYEAEMNHIEMYARMIPHLLKFSQFDKYHKSFGNAFNKFDIQRQRSPHQTGSTDCGAFLIKYVELLMIGKDVEKFQPEDIKEFRKELVANLWAYGEWKRNSGYDTPPENVGNDYDSENEICCPKEL
ncbi:uncharacterized protein [Nicotiana sylvestris]|uniref:uncharacterized protein n=1 Tax=Nicotiana sylvestris TaxID=4096 RepID=UPI00388CAAC1